MLDALHRAGHKYLKLLFVAALAGSSALFFIGVAVPKPPVMVIVLIGATMGIALEWSYFVVSCDLTESITEGHKGGIALNLFYTVVGGIASWFLFTNAALHVGWAPTDELLGLSRTTWAMIMGALVVVVIFILSARRKRPKEATDLQAIARSIMILLPEAPDAVRLRMLSTMAVEAAKYSESKSQLKALSEASMMPPASAVSEEAKSVANAAVVSASLPLPGIHAGGNHHQSEKTGGPLQMLAGGQERQGADEDSFRSSRPSGG